MPLLWTIPREAMAALEEASRQRFRKQAQARLAEAFPKKARELGDEGFTGAVSDGIATAVSHGIAAESDLDRYLQLWFRSDLDGQRWSPILERRDLDGAGKVLLIEATLDEG